MTEKNLLGDEIFDLIQQHGKKQFESALAVTRRVARGEEVSDGELLDALHIYTVNLDVFNPLLPVASEVFKRFMDKIGMTETPGGIKREWCDDDGEDEASDETGRYSTAGGNDPFEVV